jgi:hypothetical protein
MSREPGEPVPAHLAGVAAELDKEAARPVGPDLGLGGQHGFLSLLRSWQA